jgi:outer membrane protein TolC
MLMPVLEMRMAEGAFGAGPGAGLGWDNRWDLNLQARWNLNGLVAARDRQRVAQSKLEQVHLLYQDLRSKLTAGVQEARESIVRGKEQLTLGEQQIHHAQRAYEFSRKRWLGKVKDSSMSEVVQMLRGLELAQFTQLATIGAYDKAQIRLMVLLGPAYCSQAAVPATRPEALPVPEEKKP